jgi:Domain of unknown function (DUF4350)
VRRATTADRGRRSLAILAGALALFVAAIVVVDRFTAAPHGPESSSYATTGAGLAAYASLLARDGHPVRRLRAAVAAAPPPVGDTVVVLDPDAMEPAEARAIGAWVRRGGRLVAGGARSAWLREVVGSAPRYATGAPAARAPLAPVAETAGVRSVRSLGGAWRGAGSALPAVGPASAPLLLVARAARGSVALLADPAPLQNRLLGAADDAALGLALAGPRGRPVAFLETVHGYGAARGLAALPSRVLWMLAGLGLAALTALWAAGRRLGPPEDAERPLPPPRSEYVDALAAALERTRW